MATETAARDQTGIRLSGLSHMAVPVRDEYRAAKFYMTILNADLDHLSQTVRDALPDRLKEKYGPTARGGLGMTVCDGFLINLFTQDYGQPAPGQHHPHFSFEVRGTDLWQWVEHLTYWGVPFGGPEIHHHSGNVSIYFSDPDGNRVELHCKTVTEELMQQLLPGKPLSMPLNDKGERLGRQTARRTHRMWCDVPQPHLRVPELGTIRSRRPGGPERTGHEGFRRRFLRI